MSNLNWYNDFEKMYYETNKTIINKHHFESYHDFLENKLNEIINDDSNVFKIESSNKVISVKFSNIEFRKPLNNKGEPLIPNECRLKNLNYFLDVIVTVTINIKDTTPIVIDDFEFCKLPIKPSINKF